MPERVILCIGTKKGLFVAEAPKTRRSFALRGPFGPGVAVYSALIDTRGTPRLYASSCNPFFGMKVLRSTDLGKTFKETKSAPAFPKDDGRALANIWSLEAGDGKKDLLVRRRAGVALPEQRRRRFLGDGRRASATTSTPASGSPGNGGLCMHTILRDGNRVHLGISTGGHYLSEDGGETFTAVEQGRRRRLRARSLSRVRPVRAQDRRPPGRARPALHAEPRRLGRMGRARGAAAGHRRAAQRRPRPHLALDRQGAAVRLRLPDRRASARPRHGLRHAARADDAHLSGRRARGLAQRERRRLVEAARHAGCRRRRASSRSCATRWTSTSSSRPRSTSAPRPASSGSGATAARSGAACSTRSRRSTA